MARILVSERCAKDTSYLFTISTVTVAFFHHVDFPRLDRGCNHAQINTPRHIDIGNAMTF